MNVIIAMDARIYINNDRVFLSEKLYYIIKRYYDTFKNVKLIARKAKEFVNASAIDATDIIKESLIFENFRELLSHTFKKKIKNYLLDCNLLIGRFESLSSCLVANYARKAKIPYLAEVMSDAWDGYWNHGFFGKVVAPFMYFKNKKAIKEANYAIYVTQDFLQKRYPNHGKNIGISNVRIESIDKNIISSRLEKIDKMDMTNITLLTTASVNVKYKGQQFVIKSIPLLKRKGINVKYYLIGGGKQDYLKKIAKREGVLDNIAFLGRKDLKDIFLLIDKMDFYIQPSLQEGLPRSVIEAMSRGCPCLGSNTAGIPELISKSCIFRKKSSKDIANIILKILERENIREIAKMNYDNSFDYLDNRLAIIRNSFLKSIEQEINTK